jgi:hypothetical protein
MIAIIREIFEQKCVGTQERSRKEKRVKNVPVRAQKSLSTYTLLSIKSYFPATIPGPRQKTSIFGNLTFSYVADMTEIW